jgi:hypothetical protein
VGITILLKNAVVPKGPSIHPSMVSPCLAVPSHTPRHWILAPWWRSGEYHVTPVADNTQKYHSGQELGGYYTGDLRNAWAQQHVILLDIDLLILREVFLIREEELAIGCRRLQPVEQHLGLGHPLLLCGHIHKLAFSEYLALVLDVLLHFILTVFSLLLNYLTKNLMDL